MRKNFGPKPWLYPMPVLIIGTYDEAGVPDAMNAAWGMISDMNKVTICLAARHKTVKNIIRKMAVSDLLAEEHAAQCRQIGKGEMPYQASLFE